MAEQTNKLKIIRGTGSSRATFDQSKKDTVIEICFNPTQYSLDKKNTFSEAKIPGLGSPIIQFSQGDSRTLSLELMLDTYRYGKGEDLREKYIKPLEKLINIDEEIHAPPPCKIVWGTLLFVGLLDSLRKQYTLFREDGTPVRARVTLSFKEYIPVDIQVRKPPRSSPDRLKCRFVKDGDSLWQLADNAYGDPAQWRLIAEANDIDDPMELQTGREIAIPILEDNRRLP